MSKYNNKKCEYKDIQFDSDLEMRYFQYLEENKISLGIKEIGMKKKYIIFPSYNFNGKKVQPITYTSDFELEYENGKRETIDVKGKRTEAFNLKKKMFESQFNELKLIGYSKIDGGWVEHSVIEKARKERKKLKEINKSNKI